MKTLFTCLFLLNYLFSYSQDNSKEETFIILYTVGDSWDTTKQFHEQKYFAEHSSHLSGLRKEKKITIGGRYSDTGMILLKAKNEIEAHELINKDVSVQNKLFKAQIFSFDAFYSGCIEENK